MHSARRRRWAWGVVWVAACPCAGQTPSDSELALSIQPPPPDVATRPVGRFGDADTQWITIGGGVAADFDTARDINLHAAYGRFLVDAVELSLELGAWYFDQDGPNAAGINPALVFRWHLWRGETWTVYHDAGIGLLLTTDHVPDGGTTFDFTPRLGGGVTYALDADTRLQVGLRWHHISNARINGDTDNPGRDGLMLYVGLVRRW